MAVFYRSFARMPPAVGTSVDSNTSGYVRSRQNTSADSYTSVYVNIRQHPSGYLQKIWVFASVLFFYLGQKNAASAAY